MDKKQKEFSKEIYAYVLRKMDRIKADGYRGEDAWQFLRKILREKAKGE